MKYDSPTLKFSISGLRGVYPADISPDKWVEYVRAFSATLPAGAIAIARDARATGPALINIAAGVLTLLGREVHDLGLVPTPTIKAYVKAKKLAGGLMVSASHNPAEYNALKFIGKDGFFFDAAANARFSEALDGWAEWGSYKVQGKIIAAHDAAIALHAASIAKVVKKPKRRLKVVIDPVGSCGGEIAVYLLKKLGIKFEAIHLAETNEFPRPPEPTAEALGKLGAAVRKHKADIGFAFDPDADRLSLVDEKGRAIGEEYTLPLAILAAAKPGGVIVANLSTSMLTESAARLKKCKFVRSTVGEANVVAEMLRTKSLFGGEGNGGVIDARVPSFGRDALTGMAHVLALVASAKKPLSFWVASLPRFQMVKAVRKGVSAEAIEAAAQKAMAIVDGAKLDTRDGSYISGKIAGSPVWIHLRASNTEPVVRIIAEAASQKEIDIMLKAIDL
ncbi:MAG: phosphoglucosamine mutase [Turneriella sp.]|nr:phosphoglucosamine mutase [Turneriella sp.]